MYRRVNGLELHLLDAEQNVERRQPDEGIVLTASNGYHLIEAFTDETELLQGSVEMTEAVHSHRSRRPCGRYAWWASAGVAAGTD